MATYNWSLRPGIPNKYSIIIPSTADNVRPSGFAYVALFGNDTTGNGSRMYPYKTVAIARVATGGHIILGSGVYRELANFGASGFADGDVVFDNTIIGTPMSISMWGFTFKGKDGVGLFNSKYFNCFTSSILNIDSPDTIQYGIIKSATRIGLTSTPGLSVNDAGNNTFLDSKIEINSGVGGTDSISYVSCFYFSIFDNCEFTLRNSGGIVGIPIFDYCLFNDCKFRILNSDSFTEINTKEDLLTFIRAAQPSYLGLENCVVGDPKFNERSIGDYSLMFDSPAKNRSYFGTYVGSQSIGYSIKAKAIEADGDFDFSTSINLTIADNSIKFVDDTLEASIETNVKTNLIGREFGRSPIYGFNADRNGQYIDSIADLSEITISPGTLLIVNTPYIVEVASIVYNGSIILPGERFTTGTELSFTSDSGGIVREITEAPQRHTLLARFSDGGATITAGTALVIGNWYYVTGTVTYNAVDYTDKTFKAIDTNPFTGTGIVRVAMSDETYQHYEYGIKFTSNNFGDTRTGAIIRGNGDPSYERGTGKEFPINARFIQIKYILQPNNLKP